MIGLFVRGLTWMIRCVAAILVGVALLIVGTCSWKSFTESRLAARCLNNPRIQISVGRALYSVPSHQLFFTEPQDIAGILNVGRRDRTGRWLHHCQERGFATPKAQSFGWTADNVKGAKRERISLKIVAADGLSFSAKPSWRPIKLSDVESVGLGKVIDIPPSELEDLSGGVSILTVPVVLRLRNNLDRTIQVDCDWFPRPVLAAGTGPWIGSCRPYLPLEDGNYLQIFTGGTPKADLRPIISDIEVALDRATEIAR